MRIDSYLRYVPQIEESIRQNKPDSIVFGMGPTAWLLPWIDQTLLADVELWTCHDGCRIMPADHVVIMDPPQRTLHPDTRRHQHIIECRPKHFWIINTAWQIERPGTDPKPLWKKYFPKSVQGITNVLQFRVWSPDRHPKTVHAKLDSVDKHGNITPDTIAVSPTGTTTLAWSQGRRRIGVIGVDMMNGHHHTHGRWPQVDNFFRCICDQAHNKDGLIFNLSPITSLKGFKQWKPPTSGSPVIDGSETPEPKRSLITAFASTPPVQ